MLAAGTIVRVVLAGIDTLIAWDSRPVASRVPENLPGSLTILRDDIQTDSVLSAVGDVLTNSYGYTATVDVQVTDGGAYTSAGDVASAVAGAFYAATGYPATSVSVVSVNGASTGQPAASNPSNPLAGVSGAISDLVSGIGNIPRAVLVLGVVALVGVAVVVWGPRHNLKLGFLK
jgi:hypothetical protein